MTPSTPRTNNALIFKPSAGTLSWSGLLLALLCAFLLPGCGKKTNSKLAMELEGLESATATERADALLHLTDMGEEAESAAPKAIELLTDASSDVRSAAIGLIAKLKVNTPESVAGLSKAASGDEDEGIRSSALDALHAVGAHEEHVNVCKGLLASDDERQRGQAAMGLSEAGEHAAAAQTELVAALEDKEPYVRMYAAMALGNLGSKAASAKAKLEALTSDKEADVAAAAKEALEKIQ